MHGAQEFRWGCKKDQAHVPLVTFEKDTNPKKYLQCTYGPIVKVEAQGPNQEPPHFHEDAEWVGTGEKKEKKAFGSPTNITQKKICEYTGQQRDMHR